MLFFVDSEEEARMKIYSVSTRHYFAFGALVSEELSYKLKGIVHSSNFKDFVLNFVFSFISSVLYFSNCRTSQSSMGST